MTDWLVGVDVGASGSRLALVPLVDGAPVWADARRATGERLSVGTGGSTGAQVALDLVERALALCDDVRPDDVLGAAAGVAGLETNVTDPGSYLPRLRALLPRDGARAVLSGDMLTAHLGALGTAGAVLAAGTGSIALGTDLDTRWHRVDGWGYLVGDLGAGAWIGMRGLQLAAAAVQRHVVPLFSALLFAARLAQLVLSLRHAPVPPGG